MAKPPLPDPDAPLAASDSGNRSPEENNSERWFQEEIEAERWDQRWPYQLLVVSRDGSSNSYRTLQGWKFTLPIPPQQLAIGMAFASSVSATLDGVVEENSGAPFRSIRLAGTTGIMPTRPTAGQNGTPSAAGSIFSGTIAAATRAGTATAKLSSSARSLLGGAGDSPVLNLIEDSEWKANKELTGYFQFHRLRQFLERYAAFRRTKDGHNCALAFAIWKDQSVYLVTPQEFALERGADSPLEYRYSLSLKAWRRIDLNGSEITKPVQIDALFKRDAGLVAKIANTLADARQIVAEARGVVEAFGGDVERSLFEPLRELTLFAKDAVNAPFSLADMSLRIVQDARGAVLTAIGLAKDVNSFTGRAKAAAGRVGEETGKLKKEWEELGNLLRGELQDGQFAQPTLGSVTAQPQRAGDVARRAPQPATNIFEKPSRNYRLFAAISPDDLNLPPRTRRAIQEEVSRVRRLGRKDIDARRQAILQAAGLVADQAGAGDATYAATYGTTTPTSTRTPSREALRVMHALNDAALAAAKLATYGADAAEEAVVRGMEQLGGHAANSGIPFAVPRSKFTVPLPFGMTLERLATMYLGTPDRWHEIAALNGLRAPYIDETGWTKTLSTPARGNEVVVANDENVFIGQTVWVTNPYMPRTKRHILDIHRTPGQVAVVLDGEPDLDRYIVGSALQGFQPGTVNSMSLVYIPSDAAPDGGFRVAGNVNVPVFNAIASAGGVDLLLDSTNDLVVTPDGDGRWASGITNLTQQFKILIGLRKGTLLHHTDHGLGLRPGESTADLSGPEVVAAVRAALKADPAFSAIKQVTLSKVGPSVRLTVQAQVGESNIALPLSIELG